MTGPCRSTDSRRAGPTGILVAGSIARGMVAAGYRPDLYDATGALFGLADMAVIMYAPRGNGSAGTASQLSEGFRIMGATPAVPGGFSRGCVGTPRRARSAWPRRHDEAGAGRVRSRPPSASGRRNGHGSRYRRRENLHAPPKSGPWSVGADDHDVTGQHGRAPGAPPGYHPQRRDPAASQATEVSVVTADESRWPCPTTGEGSARRWTRSATNSDRRRVHSGAPPAGRPTLPSAGAYQRRRAQVQAPMPWILASLLAVAICSALVARSARGAYLRPPAAFQLDWVNCNPP